MKKNSGFLKEILISCTLGITIGVGTYYAPIAQAAMIANNVRATVECLNLSSKSCGNNFKVVEEIDKKIMYININTTRGCIKFLESYVSSLPPKSPEVMATSVSVNGISAIQEGQLSYARQNICEQAKKQIEIHIPNEVDNVEKSRAILHGYK